MPTLIGSAGGESDPCREMLGGDASVLGSVVLGSLALELALLVLLPLGPSPGTPWTAGTVGRVRVSVGWPGEARPATRDLASIARGRERRQRRTRAKLARAVSVTAPRG